MKIETVDEWKLRTKKEPTMVNFSDVWNREKKKSIPNYINWNKVHESRKKMKKAKASGF